jgi:hypothetical protein
MVWSAAARAQEAGYFQQGVAAPSNALELALSAGYTQGFGMASPDKSIADIAGPGIGIDVDVGYRATPAWAIGLQAEYAQFQSAFNTAARGVVGNVGVTYHAAPHLRGDPSVRIASGYRLLWDVSPLAFPTTVRDGFEIVKATVAYDIRLSNAFALAPQVGADVNLLVWQRRDGTDVALSAPQLASFVFAGVQGRFDVGGERPDRGTRLGKSNGESR